MIICPKCTKENQDHYKFCLGCGAELPRDGSPKKFAPATSDAPAASPAAGPGPSAPPAASAGYSGASMGQVAPGPQRFMDEATSLGAGDPLVGDTPPVMCPQCSHPNPTTNKFCASCGFKLGKPLAAGPASDVAVGDVSSAAPPLPAQAAAPPGEFANPIPGGVSLTALRADGTESGYFHMPSTPLTVGRDTGGVFAGDSYLSPKHATFTPKGKQVTVRDESSLNGVYRKLTRDEPVEIALGDVFRIGQEILRVEPLNPLPKSADGVDRLGSPSKGYVARIALVIGRDTTGNAYPIPESGLHLGRERGDVLFPEDGYVSGLHCRISYQSGKLFITDLGSSNGSFVRIYKDTILSTGDVLLMGQQLFRVAVNA